MSVKHILVDSEDRRAYALKVVGGLPVEPAFDVSIGPHVEQRSKEQNSRLWALHQLAAEHVGCSAAEMHEEMLCEHFGYNEVTLPTGRIIRVPLKRSSARDKKEFKDFMEATENLYITKLGVWLE